LGQGHDTIFGMRTSSGAWLSSSVVVRATQSDTDTTVLQLVDTKSLLRAE
jgi:hypothetical protein